MADSRRFWVSMGISGSVFVMMAIERLLSQGLVIDVALFGLGGCGMLLPAMYGALYPQRVDGPANDSPFTYAAILGAIFAIVSLLLRLT